MVFVQRFTVVVAWGEGLKVKQYHNFIIFVKKCTARFSMYSNLNINIIPNG